MNLDNIRIVLVGTTHPGNIGSTARAMKTMSLRRLHLVGPKLYPDPQAEATAANARDVLDAAQVHDDLESALGGTGLVVGLTARARRWEAPAMAPSAAAELIAAESERHPVALLFGREHSGLTNAEVDRCQRVVHIPANPEYSSLNLAAAVQIMAYELYRRHGAVTAPADALEPAGFEHLENFYRRVESAMNTAGVAGNQPADVLMRRLRRFFNRARPEPAELDILHGLLAALEKRLKRYQNGPE